MPRPDVSAAPAASVPAPEEIELKLALAPGAPARVFGLPALAGQAPAVRTMANAYFDTPEGTLAQARMALRLRRVEGKILQTLKTAGHGGGGLSTRKEWEWEVANGELDTAGLGEIAPVRALGRDVLTRLEPCLNTDFTRRQLTLGYGRSVIEVALDEGEIRAGNACAPIRELELELKSGEACDLWALADKLAQSVALRPSDASKAARGKALARGEWTLPDAHTPAEWLHRGLAALDAFHDSGQAAFLDAAHHALSTLARHAGLTEAERISAQALAAGLDDDGQPTAAFGSAALALARSAAS